MEVQDRIKLAASLLLVVLGVAGFYLLGSANQFVRVFSVIAGVACGAGLMLTTGQGKSFVEFARDAWNEAKKVVWPTRKETIQVTAVVFAFVLVLALFMWLVDSSLSWLFYEVLLGRGK